MRLKLTVEYDGTPFRGWAAQPGLPTVEAAVREALAQTYASSSGLAVAGRTDAGVHALANVVSVDVEGGPPVERAAEALNTRAARRGVDRRRPRRRRRTSTPASRRARAATATASSTGAAARRSSAAAAGGCRGRSTRSRCTRRAALLARRARLPRVHADADAAQGLRPHRRAGRVDRARRPPRLRDHGGQLSPLHGAHARRDDARVGPGRDRAAPRRRGRATRRGRRRRRGGSTSSRVAY